MKKYLLVILMVLSQPAFSNILERTFDKFSYVIFKAGWPTASYVDHEFFDVNLSERYVTVKMNGTSYWSDGKLNMLLKVTFNSNYGIEDVDVVRHNALLMPPFKTLEGLGRIIEESNSSSNSYSSPSSTPNYAYSSSENSIDNVSVKNTCHKPIRIAVRYRNMNDTWITSGWWTFTPSEEAILTSNNKRLETDNSILYYFAETTDKKIIWEGSENSKYFEGRRLDMRKINDEYGDIDISLSCNR